MRIRGWSIDGFGIFQDYAVRDLPTGLTIFHGANEAGKSTLLAFLRGMLFGFPDRRAAQPRYPPLGGVRHGGRIVIDEGDGPIVIERDASRRAVLQVTRADGTSGSIDDVQRLLGGADEQLFRSIFAFSLTELQSFESLTVNGIRDRIFTAGIAGAGRSARAVIQRLNERARDLLKRTGRARINILVHELNRVRDALDTARAAAAQYRDRVAEEGRYEETTRQLAAALAQARSAAERYATLCELWPTWCAMQAAQREREGLESIAELPVDAEVRLAVLDARAQGAHRALEEIAAARDAARAEHERLERERDDGAQNDAIDRLYGELPLRRDRLRALAAARSHLAAADAELAARVAQLGPDWDTDRFVAFLGQQPTLDAVHAWEQRLANATFEEARACDAAAQSIQHEQALRDERARLQGRMAADPPPSSTCLDERESAVRRLRANIVELRAVQSDAEASERVVTDNTQALRVFEATTLRIRPRWVGVGLALALLGGGGVAAWREQLEDRPGALIAGGLALVVVAGLWMFRRWVRRHEQERRTHVGKLVVDIEHAMQARQGYRARAAAIRSSIAVDRDALKLPTLSYDAIDEYDGLLQRQRAERARWDELAEHVAQLDDTIANAERVAAAATDGRALAERAHADAQQGWAEWLGQHGLAGAGDPARVTELLGGVERCREIWSQRDAVRAEGDALAQDIAAWEGRAHAVVAPMGAAVPPIRGEACLAAIATLHERWRAERQRRRAQARLEEDLSALTLRRAQHERERDTIDAERHRLFRECGAADDAELRHRLEVYRRRLELERTIGGCDREISARVGAEHAAATRADLIAGDVPGWQARHAAIAQEIRALDAQRDEAVRQHHDARRLRRELEDSAAVATLEAEYEGLRAELNAAVHEWRVTTGARALIDETLREFERTRQPVVLAEAATIFATVTAGRYTRVLQDDDEIVVIDQGGGRKRPHELSRGTVEQLYLCIRLGLAAEFGRRTTRLPVIMDDVLVNFDPDRARALATALATFAESHQVLFFTCQPATRDLLVGVGGAARVVEMGRGGEGSGSG